jgi:hypothetical protein
MDILEIFLQKYMENEDSFTKLTKSLVAMAIAIAQETMPGHCNSEALLARKKTS